MRALQSSHHLLSFREYQGALSRSVYPIRLDLPGSSDAFRGRLQLGRPGAIEMIHAHADSSFHCMQQPALRRDGEHRLILKMQLNGKTSYKHADRALECGAGDIALFTDQEMIEGEQHGAADALVIKLPVSKVQATTPGVLSAIGRVVPTRGASGSILALTLREIWSMMERGRSESYDSLLTSMLHLIDASIVDGLEAPDDIQRCKADPRFNRMRGYISTHCARPDLTVDHLAVELAMSRSKLFDLTRGAGTTIERMIMEARLGKAQCLLSDPAAADMTITTLAYDLGFKHPSHLSRAFHALTGMSPLAFRKRALVHRD